MVFLSRSAHSAGDSEAALAHIRIACASANPWSAIDAKQRAGDSSIAPMHSCLPCSIVRFVVPWVAAT